MKNIGENIKKFRIFRNMTQVELGRAVNRSKNVISNWERGDNSPDLDTLEAICKVLKVTPNQMFGWEKCMEYEEYNKAKQKAEFVLRRLEKQRSDIDLQIKNQQMLIYQMNAQPEEEEEEEDGD